MEREEGQKVNILGLTERHGIYKKYDIYIYLYIYNLSWWKLRRKIPYI